MLTYDLTVRGRKTMYEYLYEAMKADILSGRLTAGEKLPSKRAFAEHLQVSVGGEERIFCQSSGSEEHSRSGVCFLCDPLP